MDDAGANGAMRGVPVSKKSALRNLGGKYLQFLAGVFATPYPESANDAGE